MNTTQKATIMFWASGLIAIVCHIGWLAIGFKFGKEYIPLAKILIIIELIAAAFWWWVVFHYRDYLVRSRW